MAPQLTATKDFPERSLSPLDGAGDHFLADARFAFDEDGDIGLRAAAAEAHDIGHGGRGGDQIGETEGAAHLLVQPLDLFGERIDLEQVLNRYFKAFGRHRLDHEIVGPSPHRLDHRLDRALRRLHDHRQVAPHPLQFFKKFEAIHPRHVEIENDQFDGPAGGAAQRLEPPGRAVDGHGLEAKALDEFFKDAALGGIVFDNEDAGSHDSKTTLGWSQTLRVERGRRPLPPCSPQSGRRG